jgi:hypothetical protein
MRIGYGVLGWELLIIETCKNLLVDFCSLLCPTQYNINLNNMMFSLKFKIYSLDFNFLAVSFLKIMLLFDYHLITSSQIQLVPFAPKVTKMTGGSHSFDYDQLIPRVVITKS